MVTDLLFIFQQEHYDAKRFLLFAYTNIRWWGLQQRQTLDYTLKIRLLLVGYLLSTTAVVGVVAWLYGWWALAALVLWYLITPAVIVLLSIPLLPLEYLVKKRSYDEVGCIFAQGKPIVIGITGSYGKTSIKEILKTTLESVGKNVIATPGNINTTIGVAHFIIANREDIQRVDYLIIEMGAYHVGNIAQTARLVQPEYSFLTAVGPVHLERFGTQDRIIQAKSELLQETSIRSFVNAGGGLTKESVAFSGKNNCTMVRSDGVQNIEPRADFAGLSFMYEGVAYKTKLLAEHNIDLLLMAIEFLKDQGVTSELIVNAIASTKPFSHRLEVQHNAANGVWVIDDSYNGNQAGFVSGVKVLQRATGRKIVMTPGVVELGDESKRVHQEIAQMYIDQVDLVLLVSSKGAGYIREYFDDHHYKQYRWYETATAAHADLSHVLQRGDTILFSNDLSDNYR